MITGAGGIVAYLGTNNAAEVEKRIEQGDTEAKKVYDAMIYQISKEIGALATVVAGKLDAILITGGIAHSKYVTDQIKERVSFLAPIYCYPGEDELQALAEGVYFAKKGEIEIKEYN